MELIGLIILCAVIASGLKGSGGGQSGEKCPQCKRRTLHTSITGPHHMRDDCSHCDYSNVY